MTAVLFHPLRLRQFKRIYLSFKRRFFRAVFLCLSKLFDTAKKRRPGITILDFIPITVCDKLRISLHRVFAEIVGARVCLDGFTALAAFDFSHVPDRDPSLSS